MKELLKSRRGALESFINNVLDELAESLKDSHPLGVESVESVREFVVSGKLVRGIMLIEVGNALGGDETSLLLAATGIELAHSAILMQDDIMDQDDLRRGVSSVHANFRQQAINEQLHEPGRYGESQAVSVADILLFKSFSLLTQAGVLSECAVELSQTFAKRFIDCGVGQLIDVYTTHAGQASELDVSKTHQLKTASYTFSAPAEIAVLIAQRDDLKSLVGQLGTQLGLIYQIVDDNFAYVSSDEAAGKIVSSDILEAKQTLQKIFLYKNANDEQAEFLDLVFGNQEASNSDLKKLRTLASDLQLQQFVASQIDALANNCRQLIKELPPKLTEFYDTVLKFNLERSK